MLHLLPVLLLSASLCLTTVSGNNYVHDVSGCQFRYYGKSYSTLYITLNDEVTAVCFEAHYTDRTTQDCIIGPPPTFNDDPSPTTTFPSSDDTISKFSRVLPTILQTPLCDTTMDIPIQAFPATLNFVTYRTQSVFEIVYERSGVTDFDLTINGVLQDKLTINNSDSPPDDGAVREVTACRESGILYLPDEEISSFPENCTKINCDSVGEIETLDCKNLERCLGNGVCLFDPVCTVTGPTIIGFRNQLHTVMDRCDYDLWGTVFTTTTLRGHFRERLRKDVMFLDSVSLLIDNDRLTLGQGGTVLVNNQVHNVNSTPQEVVGVTLYKNEAGVHAKAVVDGKLGVHLLFDGYTAQLQLTGDQQGFLFQGACASDNLLGARQGSSGDACTEQYNQTADSTVNCTQMTERCNVLNDAPFNACHNNNTDPAPFIAACEEAMCMYPDVDGLYCQFLEAYAGACNLRSDVLDNWWQDVSCSPPQALCQDLICGDHEYCGDNVKGQTACLCRAIFAYPFRSTDSFGEPTVCGRDSSSLSLVRCLLAEKGIDYTTLHLNDADCTGHLNENQFVTFSFSSTNTCGAVITANNSHIIYTNTIVGQNSSSGVITRQDQIQIEFSCFYTQPEDEMLSFRIRESSIVREITSESGNYTLTMAAYTDADLSNTLEATDYVMLEQMIWVKLDSDGLEGGFVDLVTDSCWATSQPDPNSTPRYDLITDGCPSDSTVTVEGNGDGTSNSFSFKMFQFSGNSGDVFLHCQMHLCVAQNETCVPDCSPADRRRRSATSSYVVGAPALISLSWTT